MSAERLQRWMVYGWTATAATRLPGTPKRDKATPEPANEGDREDFT